MTTEFHIEALSPNGWERETSADTPEEADELLADYVRNVPGRQHRIRKVETRDPEGVPEDERTYKIVRFYADDDLEKEVIARGLSLEDAQAHCQDRTTRREGEWFDGWEEE